MCFVLSGIRALTLRPYSSTESSAVNPRSEPLTIGALAKSAGVNVETIRFYQRRGLLAEPNRPHGGIRHYGPMDVARVRFVKSAQRLGFSLDEVAQLLKLDDGTHCREAAALASARLADVRARLNDLQRMESALSQLLEACSTRTGKVSCPLVASLREGAGVPS
jgi:MerR family mercuric resistance operon transcriptional regulator